MSIPNESKFDVLFSTVGSNPVTSLVTAVEALKPAGTLYLIGTHESLGGEKRWTTKRLTKVVRGHGFKGGVVSRVSEDGITGATRLARELLQDLGPGKVAIDFTGSTKPISSGTLSGMMSGLSSISSVFLNLRTRTVDVETPSAGTVHHHAPSVQLKFSEILEIYGGEVVDRGQDVPKDSWSVFEELWLKGVSKRERLDKIRALNRLMTMTDRANYLDLTRYSTASHLDGFDIARRFGERVGQPNGLTYWTSRFLGGTWLEEHARLAAARAFPDGDWRASVHARYANPDSNVTSNQFEVDVVGVVGHQLCVLSCSASLSKFEDPEDKGQESGLKRKLKWKLFEVMQRAKQLGGEASLVGLVCLGHGNDTSRAMLEREINAILPGPQKVRVFDNEDFDQLADKLRSWIGQEISPTRETVL